MKKSLNCYCCYLQLTSRHASFNISNPKMGISTLTPSQTFINNLNLGPNKIRPPPPYTQTILPISFLASYTTNLLSTPTPCIAYGPKHIYIKRHYHQKRQFNLCKMWCLLLIPKHPYILSNLLGHQN